MKLFGTDGIRCEANTDLLNPENVLKIALSVGSALHKNQNTKRVVIGKDTRRSCYMIEYALVSGLTSVGYDVYLAGPVPTPSIPMLINSVRADFGIMISASHNPFGDNGIKFFDENGNKFSKHMEEIIEKFFFSKQSINYANASNIGRAIRIEEASARYIEFCKSSFPRYLNLKNFKIVVDTANGAAYKVAKQIFWELDADVIAIANEPDGININYNCGSTHPDLIRKKVIEHKADLGIALDGDADRVVLIDEKGEILDGDKIIGLIAAFLHKKGKLKSNLAVSTIMSNMALEKYLADQDIKLIRADVGDRNVWELMQKHKAILGGEQSGHIILGNYSSTGDGIIAALQILSIMIQENKKLSELNDIYQNFPQILSNLRLTGSLDLKSPEISNYINDMQQKIGNEARLVVRKSGTENLLRIMIETKDNNLAHSLTNELKDYFYNITKVTT